MNTRPKRRWYQFSLRGLFFATTIFAVWLGLHVHSARRQAALIKLVRSQGGEPLYARQIGSDGTYIPALLRDLFGEDFFETIVRINYQEGKPDSDEDLSAVLRGLTSVTVINTSQSGISDEGLAYLPSLTELTCLRLPNAKITDSGLKHLEGLRDLNMLDLSGNGITDAGMMHLGTLNELEYLTLARTDITDAGLQSLARLPNLKYINASQTAVTKSGARELQRRLPNCEITY